MKKNTQAAGVHVPADVPHEQTQSYTQRYTRITQQTNRLFLFVADHKMEHLDADFCGAGISADAHDPEHIFRIASAGHVGALAVHYGLITQYGRDYKNIPYIVKLNGKTNLDAGSNRDPESRLLWSVHDVQELVDSAQLDVCGVGCTVYLGGAHEAAMLEQAAQVVHQAHAHGMVAVVWMYPRAQHLKNTSAPELAAGCAGMGAALGADFVKIQPPQTNTIDALKQASNAAGHTGLICSGGTKIEPTALLGHIHEQLSMANTRGCAVGRNIFQQPLGQAVALTQAIQALVYRHALLPEACQLFDKGRKG